MIVKCPNCGGEAEDYTDGQGGGSVYCLDGCGYQMEIPAGTRPRKKLEPQPPKAKMKKGR